MQFKVIANHLLPPGSRFSIGFNAFVATIHFSWVVILAITEASVFAELIQFSKRRHRRIKRGTGKLRN